MWTTLWRFLSSASMTSCVNCSSNFNTPGSASVCVLAAVEGGRVRRLLVADEQHRRRQDHQLLVFAHQRAQHGRARQEFSEVVHHALRLAQLLYLWARLFVVAHLLDELVQKLLRGVACV